jgi:hypothetical protein
MPVDLWGPTNQGLQNLNQAFTNKMTWDRQDRLDEENRLNSASHRELQGLQTQEAREKLGEVIRLKDKRTAAEKLVGAINPVKTVSGDTEGLGGPIQKTPDEITTEKASIYEGQGLHAEAKNIIDMNAAMADHIAKGGIEGAKAEKALGHVKTLAAALKAMDGQPDIQQRIVDFGESLGIPMKGVKITSGGIEVPVPDLDNPGKFLSGMFKILKDGEWVYHTTPAKETMEQKKELIRFGAEERARTRKPDKEGKTPEEKETEKVDKSYDKAKKGVIEFIRMNNAEIRKWTAKAKGTDENSIENKQLAEYVKANEAATDTLVKLRNKEIPPEVVYQKPSEMDGAATAAASKLIGKPAGRYKVDGVEVKWDGEKEL